MSPPPCQHLLLSFYFIIANMVGVYITSFLFFGHNKRHCDLSSPIKGRPGALCFGSPESQPLDRLRSPCILFLKMHYQSSHLHHHNAEQSKTSLSTDMLSLEKEMATPSSIPAWEIPWTEEPGGLQSMGVARVRHNLATKRGQQEAVSSLHTHASGLLERNPLL